MGFSTLVWQQVEKENSDFKSLLKTDIVSHPARAYGIGEYIYK